MKTQYEYALFSGDNTQLYVELKKLIQQLTQSPLAFINWAASLALVHKMGSFLCRKMNTITYH